MREDMKLLLVGEACMSYITPLWGFGDLCIVGYEAEVGSSSVKPNEAEVGLYYIES